MRSEARRRLLRHLLQGLLGLPGLSPVSARLQAKPLDTKLERVIQRLTAGRVPVPTQAIHIEAPDLAEDGANVPLTISSTLNGIQHWHILSDQNPVPLIATIEFSPLMEAYLKTRIRMAASGRIIVLAESGQRVWRAEKKLAVVLGGCDV